MAAGAPAVLPPSYPGRTDIPQTGDACQKRTTGGPLAASRLPLRYCHARGQARLQGIVCVAGHLACIIRPQPLGIIMKLKNTNDTPASAHFALIVTLEQ